MLLLFLILSLTPQYSTELTMMLVWGEPNDISQCNNTGNIPFIDCYTLCYNFNNCILAYESQNICYLCDFGAVESVTQKTYEDEMKVAMKVNATSSTCPAVYPVAGQVDEGYRQPTGLTKYQISYNGSIWSFDYSQASCPTGWQLFNRQKGPWCIQVFYNSANTYDWSSANVQCGLNVYGSVLTGVENNEEFNYINSTATSLWTNGLNLVWLGAVRRPECTPPSWNTTICNNTLTTFEWTDGFTTGTDGFVYWSAGNPSTDLSTPTADIQSCLALWMISAPGYDDFFCDALNTGYACGVQPS